MIIAIIILLVVFYLLNNKKASVPIVCEKHEWIYFQILPNVKYLMCKKCFKKPGE